MKTKYTALLLLGMLVNMAQTHKKSIPSTPKKERKDTLLVYSVRTGIPKGIRIALPEMNPENTIHATEIHTTTGYWYQGMLFLKVPQQKVKIVAKYPDQVRSNFVTISGERCASSGGITGVGTGKCKGMLQTKKAIPYTIEIQIEP